MLKNRTHNIYYHKASAGLRLLVTLLLLFAHTNFVFSDYNPFFAEEIIELCEQEEKETEEEVKSELFILEKLGNNPLPSITAELIQNCAFSLRELFTKIVSPPPEYCFA